MGKGDSCPLFLPWMDAPFWKVFYFMKAHHDRSAFVLEKSEWEMPVSSSMCEVYCGGNYSDF
jgi:hypothetical protein